MTSPKLSVAAVYVLVFALIIVGLFSPSAIPLQAIVCGGFPLLAYAIREHVFSIARAAFDENTSSDQPTVFPGPSTDSHLMVRHVNTWFCFDSQRFLELVAPLLFLGVFSVSLDLVGRFRLVELLVAVTRSDSRANFHAVYLVLLLGTVCAFCYSSTAFWGRRNSHYPFADFPLTKAVVVAIVYLTVIWAGVEFVLPADPWIVWRRVVVATAPIAITSMLLLWCPIGWAHISVTRVHRTRSLTLAFYASLAIMILWGIGMVIVERGICKQLSWPLLRIATTGWALVVIPVITLIPILAVVHYDQRLRLPEFRRKPGDSAAWVRLLERAHIALVRGHLVTVTIAQATFPSFLITVPLSVALCLLLPFAVTSQQSGAIVGQSVNLTNVILSSAFLATTISWLAPMLAAVSSLEETFSKAYSAGLHRCLERLNEHVLVVGYGDLGRRLVREQISKEVMRYDTLYEHIHFSENILLPTGRLAKVFTRLAAIDSAREGLQRVIRSVEQIPVTINDLTPYVLGRDLDHGDSSTPAYVVPVVVGDASSREVQDMARLSRAAFVVSLARKAGGIDAGQSVMHRLEQLNRLGRQIPCVLAIHSSTYVPYITSRVLTGGMPLHYVFPEHLEGANAANALYAAVTKYGEGEGAADTLAKRPRILVCGTGKRLFYLLDSFWKSLTRQEYDEFWHDAAASTRVMVMGCDPVFRSLAVEMSDQEKQLWQESVGSELLRRGKLGIVPTSRYVSRSPRARGPNGEHEPVGYSAPASAAPARTSPGVAFLDSESCDYELFSVVLREFKPDIILVSGHDAHYELRSLQSIVTNVSLASPIRPPLVLVSGETGQPQLAKFFWDALFYYSSIWPHVENDSWQNAYPSPWMSREVRQVDTSRTAARSRLNGDPLIDVLEDPVERITGIMRAYRAGLLSSRRTKQALPVELSVCVPDSPSFLATALAALAGLRVSRQVELKNIPSFGDAKFVLLHADEFEFRSFMYLVPVELTAYGTLSEPKFSRLAIVHGESAKQLDMDVIGEIEAMLARSLHADRRASRPSANRATQASCRTVHTELGKLERHEIPSVLGDECERQDELANAIRLASTRQCCGMPNCQIEGFHKVAEAARLTPIALKDRRDRLEMGRGLASRLLVDLVDKDEKALRYPSFPANVPVAMVRVRCKLGHKPGAFAAVVNALLCRQMEPNEDVTKRMNLTHVSAMECHDERFGLFTCYGTVDNSSHTELPKLHDVIMSTRISPMRGRTEWSAYAKQLREFMSESAAYTEVKTNEAGWLDIARVQTSRGSRSS
jgi:hypothetical protein